MEVVAVNTAALIAINLKRLGLNSAKATNPIAKIVTRSCEINIANLTKIGLGFADALNNSNNRKFSISSDILTSAKQQRFKFKLVMIE